MVSVKIFTIIIFLKPASTFSGKFYENFTIINSNLSYLILKALWDINYHTIIYLYNDKDTENLSETIYKAKKPIYNINITNVMEVTLSQDYLTSDGQNLYIILLPSLKQFEEMVHDIKKIPFWKARDRLLFITKTESGSSVNISGCFHFCMRYWIINVAIVLIDDFEQVYTYNPFRDSYLMKQDYSNMFSDKTHNLHGFLLNISMFNDDVNAVNVDNIFIGRDGFMGKTVLQAMNATHTYVIPNDSHPHSVAYSSLALGLTQMLFVTKFTGFAENRTLRDDVFPNDLLQRFAQELEDLENVVTEDTYPSDRSELVVLVPLTHTKYRFAYFEESPATWSLILFLSVFLFIYMRKVNRNMDAISVIIFIISLILGKPVREIKAKYFRMILMSSMVLAFYLITDFNCLLTSILMVPEAPYGVKNIRELSKASSAKIKTRRGTKKLLDIILNGAIRDNILSKIVVMEEPLDMNEILKCTYKYYVCKKEFAQYALMVDLIRNHRTCYKIMPEIVYSSPTSYTVTYGSPLLPRINEIIVRIVESGLQEYWKRNVTTSLHDLKNLEPQKLTSGLIFPALVLLTAGLLIATVALVFEIIWFHYKNYRSFEIRNSTLR